MSETPERHGRATGVARYQWLKLAMGLALLLPLLLLVPALACAQVSRVVVIKVDGLPNDMVDEFARERNPQTGKSMLPWIDHVFYQGGTRVTNFYVRGMSLSAPSWSLLETGQHLQIKGNVEVDRFIFLPDEPRKSNGIARVYWIIGARGTSATRILYIFISNGFADVYLPRETI